MRTMRSSSKLLALVGGATMLAGVGCNGVWGLDEGRLAGQSGGAGAASTTTTGSHTTDVTGSGSTTVTSTGTSPTSTTSTNSSTGAGGGCTLEEGITNGNFELWDTYSPQDWSRIFDNVEMTLSTVSGLTTGLSLTYASIGGGGHGGIYQTQSFLDWSGCVRLHGDSRLRDGPSGQLRAHVTLGGDRQIEADLPMGRDFQTFDITCQLPAPITGFNVELQGEDLPQGGSVTMEMNSVALDRVCCGGSEPLCDPH